MHSAGKLTIPVIESARNDGGRSGCPTVSPWWSHTSPVYRNIVAANPVTSTATIWNGIYGVERAGPERKFCARVRRASRIQVGTPAPTAEGNDPLSDAARGLGVGPAPGSAGAILPDNVSSDPDHAGRSRDRGTPRIIGSQPAPPSSRIEQETLMSPMTWLKNPGSSEMAS